jgi:hypothetical protein
VYHVIMILLVFFLFGAACNSLLPVLDLAYNLLYALAVPLLLVPVLWNAFIHGNSEDKK